MAGVLAAGAMTFAVQAPASAGIFERIFGGLSRAIEAPARLPENVRAFADPFAGMRNPQAVARKPTPARPAPTACVPATAFTSRCRRMPA